MIIEKSIFNDNQIRNQMDYLISLLLLTEKETEIKINSYINLDKSPNTIYEDVYWNGMGKKILGSDYQNNLFDLIYGSIDNLTNLNLENLSNLHEYFNQNYDQNYKPNEISKYLNKDIIKSYFNKINPYSLNHIRLIIFLYQKNKETNYILSLDEIFKLYDSDELTNELKKSICNYYIYYRLLKNPKNILDYFELNKYIKLFI